MNDALFFKNFRFNEYCHYETQHRDNSKGVEFHYVGLMKHGRGRIVSEGITLEIGENEMFYIPKGCKYHSYWIPDDYVLFDSIGFLYFPTSMPNGYSLQKIDYDQSIFDAFYPLSEDKTVNTASIGTLYQLLGLLEACMKPATTSNDVIVYERLIQIMQKEPHLTIPQYASLCKVSESLLYNYVKRISKKTPNRLRQEILCRKAEMLLCTTSDSIEEICDKLKFSSAAYFRKVFYSVYKKTPSQIRKEGRQI